MIYLKSEITYIKILNMKAVKLIGVFSIILIVVVGILQLTKSSTRNGEIIGEDDPLFEEIKENLTNDWQYMTKWDKNFYDKSVNMLDQNKKQLPESAYKSLMDHLNEIVCNKLDSIMMAEYNKENCNGIVISDNYNGLKYFLSKNTSNINNSDKRVKRLEECHKLYIDIQSFIKSPIALSPNFNIENGTWSDFSTYKENKIAKRNIFQKNKYYNYLENINWIKKGLSSIEENLDIAYISFQKVLVSSIKNAYSSVSYTDENLVKLRVVQSNYATMFGTDRLLQFVVNFQNEVERIKEDERIKLEQ